MSTGRTDSPVERLTVAALVLIAVGLATTWGGAALSAAVTGRHLGVGLDGAAKAMVALPSTLSDPVSAWPESVRPSLPGAVVYWVCTGLVAAIIGVLAVVVARRWLSRSRFGLEPRTRLGVSADARMATVKDLAPLIVHGDVPGRFILGRVDGHLVATENRMAGVDGSALQRHRARERTGDRGGVAMIGPSRCGKTTAAINGIVRWSGPAVLSSVKWDLAEPTMVRRRELGEVRIFSPTRDQSATWSPLRGAESYSVARDAAKQLCSASSKGGMNGESDYWYQQGEIVLSSLLFIAANSGGTIANVCDWVMTQDRPIDTDDGQVKPRLEALVTSSDPAVADGARRSANALSGIWQADDRYRSSVYMTAVNAIWPWTDPKVEAAALTTEIDLDWLLSGNNTLYLCAPIKDQERFGPVFGGLLGDLMDQVFDRVDRTGRPLVDPLLFVLDEAGNTPMRQLPQWASLVAGLGVQLVTIWQSKAQLDALYGVANADVILANHLTKLGFAGISDHSTLDYFTRLTGDEQVVSRTLSTPVDGDRSLSESASLLPLLSNHSLRQQRTGQALLVHGSLPPAALRR